MEDPYHNKKSLPPWNDGAVEYARKLDRELEKTWDKVLLEIRRKEREEKRKEQELLLAKKKQLRKQKKQEQLRLLFGCAIGGGAMLVASLVLAIYVSRNVVVDYSLQNTANVDLSRYNTRMQLFMTMKERGSLVLEMHGALHCPPLTAAYHEKLRGTPEQQVQNMRSKNPEYIRCTAIMQQVDSVAKAFGQQLALFRQWIATSMGFCSILVLACLFFWTQGGCFQCIFYPLYMLGGLFVLHVLESISGLSASVGAYSDNAPQYVFGQVFNVTQNFPEMDVTIKVTTILWTMLGVFEELQGILSGYEVHCAFSLVGLVVVDKFLNRLYVTKFLVFKAVAVPWSVMSTTWILFWWLLRYNLREWMFVQVDMSEGLLHGQTVGVYLCAVRYMVSLFFSWIPWSLFCAQSKDWKLLLKHAVLLCIHFWLNIRMNTLENVLFNCQDWEKISVMMEKDI